ncbi:hypothetical protein BKA83DRAFT_3376947 [Pisolithus microcarpus]|nr:hypothetical protein BKA83DRAFT_3376947 [Pisolithus microcarpus]
MTTCLSFFRYLWTPSELGYASRSTGKPTLTTVSPWHGRRGNSETWAGGTERKDFSRAPPRFPSTVLIMDAFTTISAIFAPSKVDNAVDATSSFPVDEETGGSGGTAYCVIA